MRIVCVFFPAALMHAVHPFYGTDEARVSIAGNLWYDTTGKGRYGNALDPAQLGDKDEYLKTMEANMREYDGSQVIMPKQKQKKHLK